MNAPCVLVVDDEPEVLTLIRAALGAEGFNVVTAGSVAEFWQKNTECAPDIYIVDVSLPDGSGFNVVKEIRKTSNCGILVLSGRSSETDHVVGLEIGADDYVTKPFRLRELAARVSAVYRRSSAMSLVADASPVQGAAGTQLPTVATSIDFTFDDYRISLSARQVWGPGMALVDLTTAEFDLLIALITRRKQVLSRDQIMNAIRGRDWDSYDRAIDGLVSRLRKKIPPTHNAPPYIRTVHGIGYSFIA